MTGRDHESLQARGRGRAHTGRTTMRRILTLWRSAALVLGALSGASLAAAPAVTKDSDAWRATAPPPGRVALYRDRWGVPHVQATRERDAFFGLGYAVAEDYLDDVLRQVVVGRGAMAASFGARYLEIDRLYALLRVRVAAEAGYGRLPELQRGNLDGYAAGIARYLATHPREVPGWARGITPSAVDLLAFHHFFVLMFPVNATQGIGDCARGGIQVPTTINLYLELLRSGGPANSSTAWAVAPWRTADGSTIHFGDPHNMLAIPTPEFRLHAGALELSGYLVGVPALLIGHTRSVAWSTTFGSPDVADCYELDVSERDATRYAVHGGTGEIARQVVDIPVQGAPPARVTLEYATINGIQAPIVARADRRAYAMVTPYLDGAEGSFLALDAMGRAGDMHEFRTALSAQGLFPVGLTAADASGNLYFARIGRTPRRSAARDWTRPVPVDAIDTAWDGVHAFDDLVQIMNPREGYVRETNTAPASMWAPATPFPVGKYAAYIVNETPEITSDVSATSRGERAAEVLSAAFGWTERDALALAFDERLPLTPAWQRALRAALASQIDDRHPLDAAAATVAGTVLRFDGLARRESHAALVFAYWMDAIAARAAQSAPGGRAALAARIQTGADIDVAARTLLIDALADAAARLAHDFGGREAVYGDVYRYGRAGVTVPVGGCRTPFDVTLRNLVCPKVANSVQRDAVAGQKQMMLTMFGPKLRSLSLISFGQRWRGDNAPHANDQTALAGDHAMKPTYFDYADLMASKPVRRILDTSDAGRPRQE
jgi:acyl-homoserine-lactone acylase